MRKTESLKKAVSNIFSLRTLVLILIYSVLEIMSLESAFLLRFDFNFRQFDNHLQPEALLLCLIINLLSLLFFGQFKGLLSFFHMPDLIKIFWALTVSSAIILALNFADVDGFAKIPRSVIMADYLFSLILFSAFRLTLRVYRERIATDKIHTRANKRVAIIGAGDVGTAIASNFLNHKSLGIKPVVFLDEDKTKIGKEVLGLEVASLNQNFSTISKRFGIDKAIIAISNLPKPKIGEISAKFAKIGVETSIVPSYYDLTMGFAKVSNLREVSITDVLGREAVSLASPVVDDMIKGKTIMVTGAGGSIGSELCRQIAIKAPSLLILLDHCEVQLFQIEQNLIRGEYGVPLKPLVGSVADKNRMESIIAKYKPDLIFHAAAHKHVPMMESQPGEALKNNTLGTWNLASIASAHNVEKFILISTDKAINPTNVMGATKRLAEKSIQAMQSRPGNKTQFAAVRFGNVLGSSGSVIPTFKRQISEGGPVTVTHPEVTRYFMTIPEAVGLVLQCGAQARGGEIFVLDMGEPVKVIDLARQMIRLSGFEPDIDIKIKIIGLRPGEKLYEELQHKNESLEKTGHPRIFGFVSEMPKYAEMEKVAAEIREAADSKTINELKSLIKEKVPEYCAQIYE